MADGFRNQLPSTEIRNMSICNAFEVIVKLKRSDEGPKKLQSELEHDYWLVFTRITLQRDALRLLQRDHANRQFYRRVHVAHC